jgi:hypothetical protein
MKRTFKQWGVINSTNINKKNNHLFPQILERSYTTIHYIIIIKECYGDSTGNDGGYWACYDGSLEMPVPSQGHYGFHS